MSAAPADNGYILMSFALAGKGAIAMAFGVVYLFAAELFPTSMRSCSMGLQSVAGRSGAMLAPLIANLGTISESLPLVIFGVPCIIGGVLLCSLPETAGQPLLDSIDDIQVPAKRPGVPDL